MKEGFLFGRRFGDAPEPNLATIGGGEDNVGALQRGKQGESFNGGQRLSVIVSTHRWLRHNRGSPLEQMF
jgi:hypothetical protein